MTATLVTVDAGSSSVKLAAYDLQAVAGGPSIPTTAQTGVHSALIPRCFARAEAALAPGARSAAFNILLDTFVDQNAIGDVRAVAHRIVHGGMKFSAASVLDEAAQQALARLTELAPLHMPIALDWIELCRAVFGRSIVQIGVFDTSFFAGLPPVAGHYALPLELQRTHGVRRFGFHGLAHSSMLRRVQTLRPDLDRGGRMISIQLGAGCSIAAIDRGAPLDTSMGFSPLEGLVMSTRAGDIDAGLLTFLERTAGFTPESLDRLLNSESGLLGVSGISGDMRVILKSRSPDAAFAIDLYCYRIRKYIGAYIAVLGGVDLIAFGGGVGEHSPEIRARILEGLTWCGVSVDKEKNDAARGTTEDGARISKSPGFVDVWVIAVDEGAVMAREAAAVLEETHQRRSERQSLSST
jgi:acetate kinase